MRARATADEFVRRCSKLTSVRSTGGVRFSIFCHAKDQLEHTFKVVYAVSTSSSSLVVTKAKKMLVGRLMLALCFVMLVSITTSQVLYGPGVVPVAAPVYPAVYPAVVPFNPV